MMPPLPSLMPLPARRLVNIQPRPLTPALGFDAASLAAAASAAAAAAEKDAKRSKHRLAVKRAYHERLNLLGTLRAQEKELETQYEELLKRSRLKATESPQNSPREPSAEPLSAFETGADAHSAKELCVKLLEVKAELERENAALRETLKQYEHFQTRARLALESEGLLEEDKAESAADDEAETLSAVVKTPPPSPIVTMEPFTLTDCYAVIHATWPKVRDFMASKSHLHLGSQVFGWMHKYRFPPACDDSEPPSKTPHTLQYSISKTFPSLGAYELSQRGWEIMTTERHYQALHSSTLSSHFHLVQRINNDNLVFLRVLKRGNQNTVFKTLLLASQFQVDKGYMTIFRALDPKLVVPGASDTSSSKDVWLDMFSWTYFEDQDDDASVKFEFGGEMRHTSTDNAKFWMMEVLLMALRWETMAVGPLFKLTSS